MFLENKINHSSNSRASFNHPWSSITSYLKKIKLYQNSKSSEIKVLATLLSGTDPPLNINKCSQGLLLCDMEVRAAGCKICQVISDRQGPLFNILY